MRTNFFGVVELIRAALPHMVQRKSGHIAVINTLDAKKGLLLDAPYVSAKFALDGFCGVLRQELHGTGVGITSVYPGSQNENKKKYIEQQSPDEPSGDNSRVRVKASS
jgi:NADP-dependent 3-hydroxy acid dehydrogenase YdfG